MSNQHKITLKSATLITHLCELFPTYTKEQLFSLILFGNVQVDNEMVRDHTRIIKKGCYLDIVEDSELKDTEGFVSRGGLKISSVINTLDVEVEGKVWLDCGCATGGFTQCLLHFGAHTVHAVDVAYNTLDYSLRIHPQVKVHERRNILHIRHLDPPADCAVSDLSFRSLRGVVGHIVGLCKEQYLLAMCKPQFEFESYMQRYGLTELIQSDHTTYNAVNNFNGVLEDKALIKRILHVLMIDLLNEQVIVRSMVPAGITGRHGNQEFFMELTACIVNADSVETPQESYTKSELNEIYFKYINQCIH